MKKQQIEDDLAKEIAAEREKDLEAHISAGMSIPEQAAIFKRGAQKAKVIVASEWSPNLDRCDSSILTMVSSHRQPPHLPRTIWL